MSRFVLRASLLMSLSILFFAVRAEAFDLGGLVKQVEAGIGGQVPRGMDVKPARAAAAPSMEMTSADKEKQEAEMYSAKLFLPADEYCDRVANNPSAKAYAKIFEKLNSVATDLKRQNRYEYEALGSRYLDQAGLLQKWVLAQIRAEGVKPETEHLLNVKVIQMANDCAMRRINDTTYFFFDPTGEKRKEWQSEQSEENQKTVLDVNGNPVKEAPSSKETPSLLANINQVDDRSLKRARITVEMLNANEVSQITSYWALALRNSDNAIKNSSQDRLEAELQRVEQWLAGDRGARPVASSANVGSNEQGATSTRPMNDAELVNRQQSLRRARQQAEETRERERKEMLAREEAEAKARIAAAAKERTRVMQAEYDLRKKPEVASAFGDCVKNETKFQASYVKYLEKLAGQAATNDQKNTLTATAAEWKKNQPTATSAMCFERMQLGFQIVGGDESSVKIASGLTDRGYDKVRKVLAAKPGVFYQAIQMQTVGLLMLVPELADDPNFRGAELNRAKAGLKQIEANQDSPEPFVWFERYAQNKAADITPIITGEVK